MVLGLEGFGVSRSAPGAGDSGLRSEDLGLWLPADKLFVLGYRV